MKKNTKEDINLKDIPNLIKAITGLSEAINKYNDIKSKEIKLMENNLRIKLTESKRAKSLISTPETEQNTQT